MIISLSKDVFQGDRNRVLNFLKFYLATKAIILLSAMDLECVRSPFMLTIKVKLKSLA